MTPAEQRRPHPALPRSTRGGSKRDRKENRRDNFVVGDVERARHSSPLPWRTRGWERETPRTSVMSSHMAVLSPPLVLRGRVRVGAERDVSVGDRAIMQVPRDRNLRRLKFARTMRQVPTDAEAKLWRALRLQRLGGYRFRRQYTVAGYILDFYCPACRLAVELDGGQHSDPAQLEYDRRRTARLNEMGIRVLRFSDRDALKETCIGGRDDSPAFGRKTAPTPALPWSTRGGSKRARQGGKRNCGRRRRENSVVGDVERPRRSSPLPWYSGGGSGWGPGAWKARGNHRNSR